MPKGTKILTDVPKEEVAEIVKGFEDEGAKVTTKEQPDGKFTITAVFPDSGADNKSTNASGQKKNAARQSSSTSTPKPPSALSPGTGASSAKALQRAGIPWTAETDSDDIVVRNVKVTAFGGGNDAGDNGQTESGVLNDGSNPSLMGCALPIKANESATKNSPLAFTPHIAWHTKVRFWQGQAESAAIETELIDNGPDVQRYPDHAGDLTVAAAQKFAPSIPLKDMANKFEMTLSYRIIGGKKFIT